MPRSDTKYTQNYGVPGPGWKENPNYSLIESKPVCWHGGVGGGGCGVFWVPLSDSGFVCGCSVVFNQTDERAKNSFIFRNYLQSILVPNLIMRNMYMFQIR